MKESMMKNLVFVNTLMNKLLIIPMFFLTMCGTAPVTPPAQACSPRLDGKPTYCPPPDLGPIFPKRKPLTPKPEIRGEIDIYNPMHWHQMQIMFQRNARRNEVEKNMTQIWGSNPIVFTVSTYFRQLLSSDIRFFMLFGAD